MDASSSSLLEYSTLSHNLQTVKDLITKKDDVEKEIKELYDVLKTQKDVGMEVPLIDVEGYPRSDIDVYSVRHARHRIICLQNDHKDLMAQIEKGLHEVHALDKEKKQATETETELKMEVKEIELPTCFAKINLVSSNSPSETAGLQVGDKLVEFGSIDAENFRSMQDIAVLVQHSVGTPIRLVVVRSSEVIQLSLTPRTWSGKGLLGCVIVPLT